MKRNDLLIIFLLAYLLGGVTMPRGTPDYQNPGYAVGQIDIDTTSMFIAKYGFVPMDNRGRKFYVSDLQNGGQDIGLNYGGGGSAPLVVVEQEKIFGTGAALRFDVVGVGAFSQIRKVYNFMEADRYGLETAFLGVLGTTNSRMYISWGRSNGFAYIAAARVNRDTTKIQIQQTAGWVDVFDINQYGYLSYGHFRMKLVADFNTGKYVRLILDNREIDISQYTLVDNAVTTKGVLGAFVGAVNDTQAAAATLYSGYVILTDNEP